MNNGFLFSLCEYLCPRSLFHFLPHLFLRVLKFFFYGTESVRGEWGGGKRQMVVVVAVIGKEEMQKS